MTARESRELDAIGRATQWINSPPLTAASLEGKVVLVQFGTYTCINWLRTLPYMRAWVQKYRQALVVIGVHTPEFEFEHDVDNVRRAMQQMRIEYPIVIDNDYSIWRAFRNQYWPALYLLDARGRIRHHHFGEGEYQQSELAVHRLLSDPATADGFVSVDRHRGRGSGGLVQLEDRGNLSRKSGGPSPGPHCERPGPSPAHGPSAGTLRDWASRRAGLSTTFTPATCIS